MTTAKERTEGLRHRLGGGWMPRYALSGRAQPGARLECRAGVADACASRSDTLETSALACRRLAWHVHACCPARSVQLPGFESDVIYLYKCSDADSMRVRSAAQRDHGGHEGAQALAQPHQEVCRAVPRCAALRALCVRRCTSSLSKTAPRWLRRRYVSGPRVLPASLPLPAATSKSTARPRALPPGASPGTRPSSSWGRWRPACCQVGREQRARAVRALHRGHTLCPLPPSLSSEQCSPPR